MKKRSFGKRNRQIDAFAVTPAKRRKLDEAGDVVHDALARGNDHYRVLNSLGLVCAQRNDRRQAGLDLKQALERKPSEPRVRTKLATALVCMDKHEEAVECGRKAEKLSPDG